MNPLTLSRAINLAMQSGNHHTAQAMTDIVTGYLPHTPQRLPLREPSAPDSVPVYAMPRTLREIPVPKPR